MAANLFVSAAVAAPLTSTVISTQKPASQLIDHLSPFIKAPGSITAIEHQLIIRANSKSISEIKKILAAIDVAPENLIIQIRKSIAQSIAQPSASNTPLSTTKIISTRTLNAPNITTYKSIEGEELIIQQSDAPEFLLQWPIRQTAPNQHYELALTVQRIGERLQLRYRLEDKRGEKATNSATKFNRVEGVLLGHMDSWIDLNANASIQPSKKSKGAHRAKNSTTLHLTTTAQGDAPLWQIKVQRER